MAEENSKTAQARYEKDYNQHVRFESHFTAADYGCVESLPMVTSAANRLACGWYSELLPRRTRLYPIISIGLKYVKIEQNSIQNTVSISRVARMAKEERTKMGIVSVSKTNNDTNPVDKT